MVVRVILFHARPWAMVDQATGQPKSGIKVSYLPVATLEPKAADDGSDFGYGIASESIPSDDLSKLKAVPGFYDVDLQYKSSKGQLVNYISSIEFVSEINVAAAGGKK